MKMMQRILLLLLVLVTLFSFVACEGIYIAPGGGIVTPGTGGGGDDEGGGVDQPELNDDPTDDFTVTVMVNGQPYSPRMDMTVYWSDGFSVHAAPLNKSGVARIDGLDGDYRVTLSAVPNEYTYNPNGNIATNDNRNITLELYPLNLLAGGGTGIYDCYSFSKTGVYSAVINDPDDAIYFQYAPETNGVYSIESWIDTTADNINPSVEIWGGSSQYKFYIETKDDGGPVGSYTINFVHTVTIADENISAGGQAVYTFAVKAESKNNKYPITVTFAVKRNGGFESSGSGYGNASGGLAVPTYDYSKYNVADHTYGAGYSLVNPEYYLSSAGVYVFDDRMYKLGSDGFYHVFDREKYPETNGYGPILYAYVSKACRFLDKPFTTIEYDSKGDVINAALSAGGYNYKHFFEGYTKLATFGNINGVSYYCSSECTCHDASVSTENWACAGTRNEFGDLIKCPNCHKDCRPLPPELQGFEGLQAYVNDDGMVAVTEDLKTFLTAYCKKEMFFWDGRGVYEREPINGKFFQAIGDSGWLFACAYYENN